ncbi:MAG: LacI family DNA-binding transcriptional regulator [Ktedonobacteraceae bacterium]
MATTIHDVARVAGVGIGTVSRVLNNSSGVRATTREKVVQAISQLNYTPDPIARSMISKRTGSIGVVVPFFTRPFFMEVLQGMEMAMEEYGSDLILYNVKTDAQRDRHFSELPTHRKVDGLVILSLSPNDAIARNFRKMVLPVVLVDAYSPLLTSLVVNNVEGAYTAVKHLIELGHRRIGFINGIIEGNFKFNQANDRLIGFHRAFGEADLLFEPELVVMAEWNRKGGREAALHLLSLELRPTALFVASDVQATGALEAAKLLGMVVPDDLSIIGYDGIELSELLGMSTIQQPMRQLGECGVRKLIEQIKNPQQLPELLRFGTTLIVRNTTAPLV